MAIDLSDDDEQRVVESIQGWLGRQGIEHFQDIKELHGTVDAYWAESGVGDLIPQFIPRSINSQEGVLLRMFMKTLDECKEWEDKDFESQWVPMLEKSIEDDEDEDED